MAGIGFTLERMAYNQTLTGAVGAYVYAAFLVAGPWIFIVLAIAGISLAACIGVCLNIEIFRSVIIYNSVFSLIVTSPISYVCTRFISDQIYKKETDKIIFSLYVAIALLAVVTIIIGGIFYGYLTGLSPQEKLASVQNLVLIGISWLLIPFLGAIQNYRLISLTFALATALMIIEIVYIPESSPLTLINTFNLGLVFINGVFLMRLNQEYGFVIKPTTELFKTLRHWELPLLGLTYGIGIWIDKIIMWFYAPSGQMVVADALQTMPDYDTPMFWAQLASIPALAVFFVHIETNFFKLSRGFYDQLNKHASKRDIEEGIDEMSRFVLSSIAKLFVTLIIISALCILISLASVDLLNLRANQLGILRVGLVAMTFHTMVMVCFIFCLYLDLRKPALIISTTYMVLNGCFTYFLLPWGFPFYGYGNMLAAALSFLVALTWLMRELSWLHFHAFVTNNDAL